MQEQNYQSCTVCLCMSVYVWHLQTVRLPHCPLEISVYIKSMREEEGDSTPNALVLFKRYDLIFFQNIHQFDFAHIMKFMRLMRKHTLSHWCHILVTYPPRFGFWRETSTHRSVHSYRECKAPLLNCQYSIFREICRHSDQMSCHRLFWARLLSEVHPDYPSFSKEQ